MITRLKNIVWKNFFLKMTTKKNNGKNSAWSIPTMAKAKAKKLHGPSHCHYAFYAGTAIRQGLLLSWHHQPNHCSFYRPLHHHHHHHHHYHHIFNPPYLGGADGCWPLCLHFRDFSQEIPVSSSSSGG